MTVPIWIIIRDMSRKKFQNGNVFEIGGRIRKVRGELSQKEFGEQLGVQAAAISKYEKGRVPDSFLLKKIADLGGVTVEWLLHGEKGKAHLQEAASPLARPEPGAPGLVEPALFAAVDKDVLTDIVEMVEEGINSRKKPMGARRKAILIALLNDK